jgi:uncharacterized caspase-like protein
VNDLHFGVVVGIDRYPAISGAETLSYARADAEMFHDWLISPSGGAVPEDNTKLLQDPGGPLASRRGAYPTQRHVNDVFAKWHETVSAQAPPGGDEWERTRLYVYVAGHGYAPSDGVAAVLLADAADNQLGYHLEIKRYVDWLVECAPFREVLVFSDCCRRRYENAALSSAPPFSTCKRNPPIEIFSILGYASRMGESALEPMHPSSADDARGVFTGAVLDGLKGAAEYRGKVTSSSLATYVRSSVMQRTERAPVPQKVEFPGDLSQEIVICKVRSVPLRRLTVTFSASAHGPVEINDGSEVVDRHVIDGKPWLVELPDGFYELKPAAGENGCPSHLFKVAKEDVNVEVP